MHRHKTSRTRPNVLVTGTPGTGKTTLCEALASATQMNHINVGNLVVEKGLHSGRDEMWNSYILDEDKVCDELEEIMCSGNTVVDHHTCDFFPERWFDLVVVLRTDNSVLYPRLEQRGFNQRKITENIECEIFQVVLEEAHDSYQQEIIVELQSNTVEEMQSNLNKLTSWVSNWKK